MSVPCVINCSTVGGGLRSSSPMMLSLTPPHEDPQFLCFRTFGIRPAVESKHILDKADDALVGALNPCLEQLLTALSSLLGCKYLMELLLVCFPNGVRRLVVIIPSTRCSPEGDVDFLQALLRRPPTVSGNSLVLLHPVVGILNFAVVGCQRMRCDGQEHDVGSRSRALGRLALGKHLQVRRLLPWMFRQYTKFWRLTLRLARVSSNFTEESSPGLKVDPVQRLLRSV